MFKRVGVLAFILTAGALFQPAAASAQDRFDRGHERVIIVQRERPRFTREYVVPERRDDWDRDRFVRDDRYRRDDDDRYAGRNRWYGRERGDDRR